MGPPAPAEPRRARPFRPGLSLRREELARVLAAVGELPADEKGLRSWCGAWERLLSLPLAPAEVLEVVDEFLILQPALERQLAAAAGDERLEDLALQVLRRAKATAEGLLDQTVDPLPAGELRRQVRQARLPAMGRILRELNPDFE